MRHLVLTAMLRASLPAFADDAPILAEARKVASAAPPPVKTPPRWSKAK